MQTEIGLRLIFKGKIRQIYSLRVGMCCFVRIEWIEKVIAFRVWVYVTECLDRFCVLGILDWVDSFIWCVFIARQNTGRDIDIAILSDRLSVCPSVRPSVCP